MKKFSVTKVKMVRETDCDLTRGERGLSEGARHETSRRHGEFSGRYTGGGGTKWIWLFCSSFGYICAENEPPRRIFECGAALGRGCGKPSDGNWWHTRIYLLQKFPEMMEYRRSSYYLCLREEDSSSICEWEQFRKST